MFDCDNPTACGVMIDLTVAAAIDYGCPTITPEIFDQMKEGAHVTDEILHLMIVQRLNEERKIAHELAAGPLLRPLVEWSNYAEDRSNLSEEWHRIFIALSTIRQMFVSICALPNDRDLYNHKRLKGTRHSAWIYYLEDLLFAEEEAKKIDLPWGE